MRLSLRSVVFLVALLTAQSVCACPEPTMDWSPNPVCVGCQSVLTLDYTPVSGYEVTYGPWVDYIAILPTSNSPTANGVIYNNVTNAVVDWSDPGFCSLVVTSKLDWFCASNNTSGTSTNSSVTPFTVVRMETFKLTDATNANNSKQDTTDGDATPTNNILYLAEDTNGNARAILNLTMTPTNGNAGSLFKWQISGSGWSPASGDFSVGTITSVWTDAGGAVDREFTVTVVCNCGAGGDCVNCTYRRMLKITILKVELITPAGDPTNAPVDSGDGQNEFTFSTNSAGVLTMNLKAMVTPTGIANQVASRCHFSVDTIGNSTMTWDAANPNGVPTASNDFLLAKVTFTGLPTNNFAFGAKKAGIYFDSTKQDEEPYEVFFAKWAKNHGGGSTNDPNWFFYWQDGAVCGIDTNCIFDGTEANTWGYCRPGVDTLVRLCGLAPESNSGPESYYSQRAYEGYGTTPNGEIIITGNGQGIQCAAETIQHECEHLNIYNLFNGQTDTDGDGIRDTSETTNNATSYGGVASDPNNADTYNMGDGYSSYGDNEIRCRKIELNLTITIYPERDWANPGCQSKTKFGP